MAYRLSAAAGTRPGRVRERNEDTLHVGGRVLVIADGVGGEAAGDAPVVVYKVIVADIILPG